MITLAIIVIPLLVAAGLFFVKDSKTARNTALVSSLISLVLTGVAWCQFLGGNLENLQFSYSWIGSLGVNFAAAIDGLSLVTVLLTALLFQLILLISFKTQYSAGFYALAMLMQSALFGVFTATDGLIFYVFWEMALIPIYFICALWGGENKIKITLKFFIYTTLGSLLMLAGLIYMYLQTPAPHSFSLSALSTAAGHLCPCKQVWIFWALFIAFAVKIPVFPFHTWQPDTYTTSPNAGSMLLAGIMLKMGIYGVIRWLIPLTPDVLAVHGSIAMVLGVIGLLYGSIIAIMQQEVKRLVAYSSMAHVGLMAAAAFALNADATRGVIIQMLSHGIVVVGLFFVADIIVRRTGTLQISSLGGIAKVAPRFAIFFMVVMLGSVALPLTSGFVGEFLMLVGLYQFNVWIAAFATISVILGAVYMFRLYQRAMYGEPSAVTQNFEDLKGLELFVAVILVILILVLGVYPKIILNLI
jgi:NADH-quinone oxidoreductase subunit M